MITCAYDTSWWNRLQRALAEASGLLMLLLCVAIVHQMTSSLLLSVNAQSVNLRRNCSVVETSSAQWSSCCVLYRTSEFDCI